MRRRTTCRIGWKSSSIVYRCFFAAMLISVFFATPRNRCPDRRRGATHLRQFHHGNQSTIGRNRVQVLFRKLVGGGLFFA